MKYEDVRIMLNIMHDISLSPEICLYLLRVFSCCRTFPILAATSVRTHPVMTTQSRVTTLQSTTTILTRLKLILENSKGKDNEFNCLAMRGVVNYSKLQRPDCPGAEPGSGRWEWKLLIHQARQSKVITTFNILWLGG